MKNLLGFVAFVLVAQGVGGVLHEITGGWFHLWTVVHRIGWLDGYEMYVCVLLIVLGVAVGCASDSVGRAGRRATGHTDGSAGERAGGDTGGSAGGGSDAPGGGER